MRRLTDSKDGVKSSTESEKSEVKVKQENNDSNDTSIDPDALFDDWRSGLEL